MTAAWSAALRVGSGDGKPARRPQRRRVRAISTTRRGRDGPAICFLRSARRERNFRGIPARTCRLDFPSPPRPRPRSPPPPAASRGGPRHHDINLQRPRETGTTRASGDVGEQDNYEVVRKVGRWKSALEGEARVRTNSRIASLRRWKKKSSARSVLQNLRAPNVIHLLDFATESKTRRHLRVREQHRFRCCTRAHRPRHPVYIFELLKALEFCHSSASCTAIKPHNVMIDHEKRQLRLIDWGLAEFSPGGVQRARRLALLQGPRPRTQVAARARIGAIRRAAIPRRNPLPAPSPLSDYETRSTCGRSAACSPGGFRRSPSSTATTTTISSSRSKGARRRPAADLLALARSPRRPSPAVCRCSAPTSSSYLDKATSATRTWRHPRPPRGRRGQVHHAENQHLVSPEATTSSTSLCYDHQDRLSPSNGTVLLRPVRSAAPPSRRPPARSVRRRGVKCSMSCGRAPSVRRRAPPRASSSAAARRRRSAARSSPGRRRARRAEFPPDASAAHDRWSSSVAVACGRWSRGHVS